jgi:starch synthase
MKVLFVTSEFAGLVKVGGLGDVSASLPAALRKRGVDVRVLLPAYPDVLAKFPAITWVDALPGRADIPPCQIGKVQLATGLPLYLVRAPLLYERAGTPYGSSDGHDWADNHLRWGRLSLAAAQIAGGAGHPGWVPDLVHANDWPSALTPAYLKWDRTPVPSVLTIHNIAYQGLYPPDMRVALGIPDDAFNVNGVEFHGHVAFLKAGSFYADHVTTVSPTYAREIATEASGAGLHGLMQARTAARQLTGIINGIDESWNPASDPHLPYHFNSGQLAGKQANADVVRTSLCLRPSKGPLLGIVARLVHQKGLELVSEAASGIVEQGGQIAILGLGDPDIEHGLSRAARRYRDDIAVLVGFNEPMARRIIAGSDFFLMPSRFEPCGLTQMQAQRYGTLPIAHAVGGLVDTIEDDTTGFLFSELTVEGVVAACRRGFDAFADQERLDQMRQAAMARCFSWSVSAAEYAALYSQLCGPPVPRQVRRSAAPKRPVEPVLKAAA